MDKREIIKEEIDYLTNQILELTLASLDDKEKEELDELKESTVRNIDLRI